MSLTENLMPFEPDEVVSKTIQRRTRLAILLGRLAAKQWLHRKAFSALASATSAVSCHEVASARNEPQKPAQENPGGQCAASYRPD